MPARTSSLVLLIALVVGLSGTVVSAQDASPVDRETVLKSISSIQNRLSQQRIDQQLIAEQRQLMADLTKLFQQEPAPNTSMGTSQTTDPTSSDSGESTPPATQTPQPAATGTDGSEQSLPPSSPFSRPELRDAVWGHLPPQEQQELFRTFNERYLPSYEDQIRRYFEKLGASAPTLEIRSSP